LQKGEVVDCGWVEGTFSYNIVLKSSEKLLVLEFKWQTIDNGKEYFNKIRFLDYFSFFPKSLSQLIQVQKSDDFSSFPLLKQHFPDGEMCDLLTFKGMYPYEYYSSASKLSDEKLPPIAESYDSLRDRQCTTANYEFAKRVRAKIRCKNGWGYCKIYLASDVLTLLDIVCKKMGKIYEEFGLDMGYYFSTPHLVMDLILKISNVEIGLITDVHQHLFVERPMRGGYIFHGHRILETDPTVQRIGEKSDAVFLDMNSLYPLEMSHLYLPCGN
jgi:hypothetical protein